jgi:hypothetical protein
MTDYKELADSLFEIAMSPKEDRIENLVSLQLAIADAKEIPNEISTLLMSIVTNLMLEVEEKLPESESKSEFDDFLMELDEELNEFDSLNDELDKLLSE